MSNNGAFDLLLYDLPSVAPEEAGFSGTVVTWNPADKHSSLQLSGGNLIVDSDTTAEGLVRGNMGKSSGKWYFEVHCYHPERGLGVPYDGITAGICSATHSLAKAIGREATGVTGQLLGASAHYRRYHPSSPPTLVAKNDVWAWGHYFPPDFETDTTGIPAALGVAVDLDAGKIWILMVGYSWMHPAGTGGTYNSFSPVNMPGGMYTWDTGVTSTVYPGASLYYGAQADDAQHIVGNPEQLRVLDDEPGAFEAGGSLYGFNAGWWEGANDGWWKV